MAAGRSEPFLPASPARTREPKFDMVREYLSRVADRVQGLERRIQQLGSELEEARRQREAAMQAPPTEDLYESMSTRVADLMRTFDQDVERLRSEAQAEAERIVADARSEAERVGQGIENLRQEARAQADRILAEARAESDRIRLDAQGKAEDVRAAAERVEHEARERISRNVSDLENQRALLVEQLRDIRRRMLETLGSLEGIVQPAPEDQGVVVVDAPDHEERSHSS
jgi:cell division septum initiation protein DivIVA